MTKRSSICLQSEGKRRNVTDEGRRISHFKGERTFRAKVGKCKKDPCGVSWIEGHSCGVRFGSERHNIRNKADRASACVSYEVKTHKENFRMATV